MCAEPAHNNFYILSILLGCIIICLIFPIPLILLLYGNSEATQIISFIVPFPQICKYQVKDYNPWNEMLCKPKSILFCNIDSNNFYKWWNFAAIIDFKWKTFGRFYYFLIWFFYTIFFICFTLAITLDLQRKILFIISIILCLIHVIFEIRQFLWRPKAYLEDFVNLFGK